MQWSRFAILLVSVALASAQETPEKANSTTKGEDKPKDNPNTRFFPGVGLGVGQAGVIQPGFGQQGFVQPGFGQPGLVQPGFGQQGFVQPGFGQQGLVQPGFGQQGFVQPGLGFGQQGTVPTGLGQGAGQPFGQSLLAQPGLGVNSFGQATLSGVPVASPGNPNRPAVSLPSNSCRQWCRGTQPGQVYCCEDNSQIATVPIVKPGRCPPRRPLCPKVHGPPQTCGDDSKCSGNDKCCLDTCLEVHVCKPPLL